jgi:hypothetical protein
MRQGFVGVERGVWSAGDDALAPLSEFAGEAVGFGGKAGEERKSDQVGIGFEINRFDLLVDDADVMFGWRDRGEMDAGDGRDEVGFMAGTVAGLVNDNDVDLHITKSTLRIKVLSVNRNFQAGLRTAERVSTIKGKAQFRPLTVHEAWLRSNAGRKPGSTARHVPRSEFR